MIGINITDKTKDAIQELISLSYINNARVDRMKSALTADLTYNETADIVHTFIAHYFSNGIGDALSEQCLERYNISVNFGGIPVMDKKYESVDEVISELLDLVIDYQNQLSKCIEIAETNMDRQIVATLYSFNVDYNKIVDQCIILKDKLGLYKDNPLFDVYIKEHFFLLNGALDLLDNIKIGGDDE